MTALQCDGCGSRQFDTSERFLICEYCGSMYIEDNTDVLTNDPRVLVSYNGNNVALGYEAPYRIPDDYVLVGEWETAFRVLA